MTRTPARPACVAAAFACAAAMAAPPASGPRPDPLDPAAVVPAVTHRSAFDRYRAAGELPLADWKAANDTVARIGGWRAYAREAATPPALAPDPGPGPGHGPGHGQGHGAGAGTTGAPR